MACTGRPWPDAALATPRPTRSCGPAGLGPRWPLGRAASSRRPRWVLRHLRPAWTTRPVSSPLPGWLSGTGPPLGCLAAPAASGPPGPPPTPRDPGVSGTPEAAAPSAGAGTGNDLCRVSTTMQVPWVDGDGAWWPVAYQAQTEYGREGPHGLGLPLLGGMRGPGRPRSTGGPTALTRWRPGAPMRAWSIADGGPSAPADCALRPWGPERTAAPGLHDPRDALLWVAAGALVAGVRVGSPTFPVCPPLRTLAPPSDGAFAGPGRYMLPGSGIRRRRVPRRCLARRPAWPKRRAGHPYRLGARTARGSGGPCGLPPAWSGWPASPTSLTARMPLCAPEGHVGSRRNSPDGLGGLGAWAALGKPATLGGLVRQGEPSALMDPSGVGTSGDVAPRGSCDRAWSAWRLW